MSFLRTLAALRRDDGVYAARWRALAEGGRS
jgi:hypothetical protein